MKALLVIGNGFDLKCKLNTKYVDFWYNQRKKYHVFNSFVEFLENNSYDSFDETKLNSISSVIEVEDGISFFDYYFTILDWMYGNLNGNKTWSDIEDMLLYGFSDTSSNGLSFNNCFSCFNEMLSNTQFPLYKEQYGHLIVSKYLKKAFGKDFGNYYIYYNYIISELDMFSVMFAKYINKQVEDNLEYYEEAQKLITRIVNYPLNQCEIISFNYTEPIASPCLANIHGLASKEKVVIGITTGEGEKKNKTHNSWYYKATKEYKIAHILANGIKVSANYDGVTEIYIYGLSLGEQDYDFFDNLFDEFDVLMRMYEVKIIFCFSTYGGKTKEEIAEETTDRVTKLINRFGDNHKTYGLLRSMIQKEHLIFKYIE